MDTNSQKMDVNIASKPMSDASPTGTFIFTFISFLFWALNIGIFQEGAILAVGLAQFGVFVAYTVVATTLLSKGASFVGNTFLVFVAVFGGVCGSANIFSVLFEHWGIPFDNRIASLFLLMSGLFLLVVLPGLWKVAAKTDFLINLIGGIGITGSALVMLGLAPAALLPVFGWVLFCVGIVGFYSFTASMLGFMGIRLPVGAPKSR